MKLHFHQSDFRSQHTAQTSKTLTSLTTIPGVIKTLQRASNGAQISHSPSVDRPVGYLFSRGSASVPDSPFLRRPSHRTLADPPGLPRAIPWSADLTIPP
jgi:hypothetical protein